MLLCLGGLKEEIAKIDRLTDYSYLEKEILDLYGLCSQTEIGGEDEYAIYLRQLKNNLSRIAIYRMFKRAINFHLKAFTSSEKKKMLANDYGNTRRYHISFTNSF